MSANDMLFLLGRVGFRLAALAAQLFCVIWFCYAAYAIRMYSIDEFGTIIHEFDPWFNYRAAEYLSYNGLSRFFKWYDYMSWYPLGRPVGTTIYPGMQMTAVGIEWLLAALPPMQFKVPTALRTVVPFLNQLRKMGAKFVPKIPKEIAIVPMSINDVCCYVPAWFGVVATFFCGMMAYEASGRSRNAAVATMGIMSIIPAHLMRSVSGEFDNECVAMWSLCCTFWLWTRSIRTPDSWPWGILTGFSYIYMVASWGGFIFVLNLIAIHACVVVLHGRFNSGVWKAYSLFWIIGTLGAIQIPVIGWNPLKSLEQISALLVFFGLHVLQYCDVQRRKRDMQAKQFVYFRIGVIISLLVGLVAVASLLAPFGYFAPLGSRIRGLFLKHTITGNPLVDSVAEHQPASAGAYRSSLHNPVAWCPLGLLLCFYVRNNSATFLVVYAFISYTFSLKMSRLLIICGPIVSALAGIGIGAVVDNCGDQFYRLLNYPPRPAADEASKPETNGKAAPDSKEKKDAKNDKNDRKAAQKKRAETDKFNSVKLEFALEEWEDEVRPGGTGQISREAKQVVYRMIPAELKEMWYTREQRQAKIPGLRAARAALAVVVLWFMWQWNLPLLNEFIRHCDSYARSLSNPQLMWKAQLRDGTTVLVDDYYAGYKWIDANTPKDSRVMAWWDYGYQITGVANRTSIADGNTWNHEHIATLGFMLTSPEKKAHKYIRHFADYVLVWAGGRGDDMGKSPHLARIANSVFSDHCGDSDPKCEKFGFYKGGKPTPMMEKSLLYKMVRNGIDPGIGMDEDLFKEVHKTKYGYMRVYKVMNVSAASKKWAADETNRKCDAPGSWYCTGEYPPAVQPLIERRRNFAQLEDFNKKGGQKSAYTKLIEKQKERGDL